MQLERQHTLNASGCLLPGKEQKWLILALTCPSSLHQRSTAAIGKREIPSPLRSQLDHKTASAVPIDSIKSSKIKKLVA